MLLTSIRESQVFHAISFSHFQIKDIANTKQAFALFYSALETKIEQSTQNVFEVNIIFHRRTEHGAKAEEFVFVDDPIFLTTRIELVQKISQGLERDTWIWASSTTGHRLTSFTDWSDFFVFFFSCTAYFVCKALLFVSDNYCVSPRLPWDHEQSIDHRYSCPLTGRDSRSPFRAVD